MVKIAFVFAGQGSQYQGMGMEIVQNSNKALEVFDRLDKIRPGTKDQCFFASKEDLSLTQNTQPCMFAVEMAIANALEENGVIPDVVAGFSLGEISALAYSNLSSLEEWFEFIMLRGSAMNSAAVNNPGKMAAILRLDASEIEKICENYESVWPVNYNCPGQTVISGIESSVTAVISECQKLGGKGIPLSVSGAFHSPLMLEASLSLKKILENKTFITPRFPIYSNVTSELMMVDEIKDLIEKHVKSPVLWSKSIENMVRDEVKVFVEIGPGKVLSGLIKKICPEAIITNVENLESLNKTLEIIGQYKS